MSLDFIQIYYKDDQLGELYPFATPYKNDSLSIYFENAVIRDLVPQCTGSLVSVCSWALSRKRRGGMTEVYLVQKFGTTQLQQASILESDLDVIKLTPVAHRDIRQKLIHWHPSAKEALQEFDKFIKYPDEVKDAIYENHFVAKREIYQDYVMNCLAPAIEFMEGKEVFRLPSGYRQKKERIVGHGATNEILDRLGMDDYPIAPFILERLFSVWINNKNLKVGFV